MQCALEAKCSPVIWNPHQVGLLADPIIPSLLAFFCTGCSLMALPFFIVVVVVVVIVGMRYCHMWSSWCRLGAAAAELFTRLYLHHDFWEVDAVTAETLVIAVTTHCELVGTNVCVCAGVPFIHHSHHTPLTHPGQLTDSKKNRNTPNKRRPKK